MIDLDHSPLGGSAAYRFLNCAGSFLLHRSLIEDGQFENIESEFSKLGTAAHALGSTCLENRCEPFEYINENIDGYRVGWPDGIKLDAVMIYTNYCMDIVEKYPGGRMIIEESFRAPWLHELLKGTIDFGYYHPDHGFWLVDYKNGEGVGVSVTNNKQLLYYAFLLILKIFEERVPENMKVRLAVVQPNFYGVYSEPEIWEIDTAFVLEWGHKVLLPAMNSLSATRDVDDTDFVPGDHCQFCPVMLECPRAQEAFQSFVDASEDFIAMLTNDELSQLYEKRDLARKFISTLENTVRARVISGGNVPSAKLVEKKVNRVFKPGAEDAFKNEFGELAYAPLSLRSPAQMEKLSSRAKELVTEWAYKPESDLLTVAPLSDPRPEAKPRTNENVFAGHAQTAEEAGW